MIKVKTFKTTDESINDFLDTVAVINNGITHSNGEIVVVYRDNKYAEFGEEEKKQELFAQLYQEQSTLLRCDLDIAYFDKKELNEHTGKDRRTLEDKRKLTENMILVITEQLA
jgi:hypothetical protein